VLDQGSPSTFWLNLTNIGLGIVALCFVLIGVWTGLREILQRHLPARDHAGELRFSGYPVLGATMADGGEPIDPQHKQPKETDGAC
jgi:hypothetical protein